ncbi:hypothetical protein [Parvularcula sp. LCG005]|uniref:hypothetical protein n=1 Tax=Parvularcula sp. LCG005 TaxID=3078805 RepID=UPI0029421E42|nr:hypothetical protein [Parvularcula sp. LCG005]WOI54444.1 hypothetical protein RUI03_05435 [Parvularcula sp. LCG005]
MTTPLSRSGRCKAERSGAVARGPAASYIQGKMIYGDVMPKDPKAGPNKSPSVDPAIERLIEDTIRSMGPVAPDALPHLLRQQLAGRIAGEIDVETYIERMAKAPRARR